MNKAAKPEADEDDLSDLYGGPPPTEAEWDAWMQAHRDEINASIEKAERELAEGKSVPWDPEAIMAEVREQLRKESR